MNCKKTRLFSLKHKSKKSALPDIVPGPIQNQEKRKEVSKESLPQKIENVDKNEFEPKIRKNNPNVIKFYMDSLISKPLKGPKYLISNGFVEFITHNKNIFDKIRIFRQKKKVSI